MSSPIGSYASVAQFSNAIGGLYIFTLSTPCGKDRGLGFHAHFVNRGLVSGLIGYLLASFPSTGHAVQGACSYMRGTRVVMGFHGYASH